MPARRRPVTATVALAVLTLGVLWLLAGPFAALAGARAAASTTAPATTNSTTAPATTTGLARPAPRPAAPSQAAGPRVELRVSTMTPRMVTSTGPPNLTVTGELVNTGDEAIRQVQIRAQRGDRLRTEGDMRTALAGNAADDAVTPAFTDVVDELAPGQRHPVELNMPLRGSTTGSLALQRSGVYELLINVNGVPEDGNQVRLAGLRMLLPVLGLPAAGGRAPEPGTPDPAGGPAPVTVLYPLADQPHRLPTGPGEPVLLGDDTLASSLAQGGRLDGLLSALETAAPSGSPLRDAVCLGVDPDLLRTVADMTGGYRVRGADGKEVDGKGANAAAQWLGRLRAFAAGRCVVAMPYADADLVALARAGLDDLARYAVKDGARIAGEILRTPVRADTTWPADGLLDERSLAGLVADGGKAAVLSSDAVAASGRSGRSTTGGTVRVAGPASAGLTGLLADPLVTLAARGEDGGTAASGLFSTDVGTGSGGRGFGALSTGLSSTSPAGTGVTLSGQDAIGAVGYRALNPSSSGSGSAASPTPLLVAPPHLWNTTGADARELLEAVSALVTAGRLTPTRLPEPLGADVSNAPSVSLVYSLRAGAREVPGTVTSRLRGDRDIANDLRAAAVPTPTVGATPAQVFDPVTEGLLRASSAVWRGQPDLAAVATKVITDRVRLLRSLVRVLEPPSPYSLGGEEAPLPITLANGLPVEMRVRVALSDTPGLRTEKIGEVRIPPMGRSTLRVNAALTRSGQFSVEAWLTTASGTQLGVPSRLLLRSTAYGTITLWLTGTAGLLLVILAVRRIVRRLRGGSAGRHAESKPDPASKSGEPPRPGPPEPEPATTPVRTSAPAGHPGSRQSVGPMGGPVSSPLGGPARYPGPPDAQPRPPATPPGSPTAHPPPPAAQPTPPATQPTPPATQPGPPMAQPAGAPRAAGPGTRPTHGGPMNQPTRRTAPSRRPPPPAGVPPRSRPTGLPPGTPGVPPGPPATPPARGPQPGAATEPPPNPGAARDPRIPDTPRTPPRRHGPPRTPRR